MSAAYDIDRIRGRLQDVQFDRMFRVIHLQHQDSPLDAVPAPSRFSDPNGRFAVLYASQAVRCSFWEALARNRFDRRKRREMPREEVMARLVVSLHSTEALSLVDLRGDGPIRISAPTAVAHDSNHAAGRTLSAATYAGIPESDGFLFSSRFTGHICAALFDRAIRKLQVEEITSLVRHADFLDALDDYDITLTESPE